MNAALHLLEIASPKGGADGMDASPAALTLLHRTHGGDIADLDGALPRTATLADWSRLERREIAAYADLLPYLRFAGIEGLASECAAALDLQRSVLHWLESLDAAEAPALAAPMPAGLRLAF